LATLGSLANAVVQKPRRSVEQYGDQLLFHVKALAWAPRAVKRYPREIVNTLAEITFGAGGLTLIAGTVGVIAFLAFFAGTEVGIQGYASLSQIGVAKFSAFISAYFNTREVAPLVSSIALAATVGCGYTASGGPAGVGMAVGRAIRTSIVTVVVADFFLSFAIWGSTTTVRITG
jgi:phospholipid/cholesterol/gamma-HCH transport system permease protein